MSRRYVIMTLDDARAAAFSGMFKPVPDSVRKRMLAETGADIEDIVEQLKDLETCTVCTVEGREHTCNVLVAQKLGRRLRRLLERARGERGPG